MPAAFYSTKETKKIYTAAYVLSSFQYYTTNITRCVLSNISYKKVFNFVLDSKKKTSICFASRRSDSKASKNANWINPSRPVTLSSPNPCAQSPPPPGTSTFLLTFPVISLHRKAAQPPPRAPWFRKQSVILRHHGDDLIYPFSSSYRLISGKQRSYYYSRDDLRRLRWSGGWAHG